MALIDDLAKNLAIEYAEALGMPVTETWQSFEQPNDEDGEPIADKLVSTVTINPGINPTRTFEYRKFGSLELGEDYLGRELSKATRKHNELGLAMTKISAKIAAMQNATRVTLP